MQKLLEKIYWYILKNSVTKLEYEIVGVPKTTLENRVII